MTPAMDILKHANTISDIYEIGRKAGVRAGLDHAKDMAIIDGHFALADKIREEMNK